MIDLLRTRRSVRKFTEQAVEPELLELLKEAVLRSPSSKNSNACEFIFIDDQILIEKLSHCRPSGASALDTAPLAVIVLSNESKTGAWTEDCSIASILLQLTAHSIGLGSCWVQIRGRDYSDEKISETYLRESLNIPEYFRILNIVAIGHPQRIHEGKPFSDLDFSRIHSNHLIPSH
jgi:nitroreductase